MPAKHMPHLKSKCEDKSASQHRQLSHQGLPLSPEITERDKMRGGSESAHGFTHFSSITQSVLKASPRDEWPSVEVETVEFDTT